MDTLTLLTFYVPCILVAISAHEMMHAVVGYWLGDDTAKIHGRITLNPLAHIDPWMTVALPAFLAVFGLPVVGAARPVPFNPNQVRWGEYGAMLVAIAGPLTNLVLAGLGVVAAITGANGLIGDIGQVFALVNFGFFVFNMIPLPPLDGSRVLYVFAPNGVRSLMDKLEDFGVFLVLALFILIFSFDTNPIADVLHWFHNQFLV